MNRRSRLIPYYFLIVSSFLLLTNISCSKNSTVHSEEWKEEQIENIYEKFAHKFPDVSSISAEELQQLHQQEKVVLVDVRTAKERKISVIPGAISQAEFEQNQHKYQNYTIVPYCTIGYRSGHYAQKLQEQGLKVLNFKGSLLSWSHVGGKLVNHQGVTNEIQVFGNKRQLTAQDYESVW